MRIGISGWSAVSAYGKGRTAFAAGVRSARDIVDDLLVPDFTPRDALGRKGTRSMDRVTGLAVSTVGDLLAEQVRDEEWSRDTGLVLGTTTGSAESIMEFTRSALEADLPYHVDPARFPNTVMNCAAGQCAIWHDLKGPNTTVAGGYAVGLQALTFARRLLANGRARRVMCGGAEECSPARAELERHATGVRAPLGEGCAVHVIEPVDAIGPGRTMLAELLTVQTGMAAGGGLRDALGACVERALRTIDIEPWQVWAIAPCGARGLAGEAEAAALDAVVPDARRLETAGRLGDLSAASVPFQLATALTAAEQDLTARGRVAVVTAVENSGTVACGVLRMPGPAASRN